MSNPDEKTHYIKPTGVIDGGHAIYSNYCSPVRYRDAFRLRNSWGLEYGERGMVWLDKTDAKALGFGRGEIWMVTEVRV